MICLNSNLCKWSLRLAIGAVLATGLTSAAMADPAQIRAAIINASKDSKCVISEKELIAKLKQSSITTQQAFEVVKQMMKEGVARRGNGRLALSNKVCPPRQPAQTATAPQQPATQQVQQQQAPQTVQAPAAVAPVPAEDQTAMADVGPATVDEEFAFLTAVRANRCFMVQDQAGLWSQAEGVAVQKMAEIVDLWLGYGDAWIEDDGTLRLADHMCGVHDVDISDFNLRADRLYAMVEANGCEFGGDDAFYRFMDAGFEEGELRSLIDLMINEGSLEAVGDLDGPYGYVVARGGNCG